MLSDFLLGLAGAKGEYALVDGQVRHWWLKNEAGQPACPIEAEAQRLGVQLTDLVGTGARMGLRPRQVLVVMDAADWTEEKFAKAYRGVDSRNDQEQHRQARALLLRLCDPAPAPQATPTPEAVPC